MAYGSIPTGPSPLYVSLLKGKITPEDYAKQAKKRVQKSFRKPPTQSASTGA